jgi:hypothetical protein
MTSSLKAPPLTGFLHDHQGPGRPRPESRIMGGHGDLMPRFIGRDLRISMETLESRAPGGSRIETCFRRRN